MNQFFKGMLVVSALMVLNAATVVALPKPAHIVIVMEENHTYNEILGSGSPCTYMLSLAAGGANMTNSYGVTHNSEINYMALFSGNEYAADNTANDACPVDASTAPTMGQSILAAGYSFCGYAETLPSAGSTVCTGGADDPSGSPYYARKHCPWINFQVNGNMPVSCNQPLTSFPTNYANLPTVSFVTPNLWDDMHDGPTTQADSWLKTNLGAYATWCQTASNNSLLIVQWDEDDKTGDNQIPTIFYGAMVTPGQYPEPAAINHYNILTTVLAMYGISNSTFDSASGAATITDIFAASASTPTATPARTNTPVAPTMTPTRVSATPTATFTPAVPTPTRTNTPLPPTATPTFTPKPDTPTPTPTKRHKG